MFVLQSRFECANELVDSELEKNVLITPDKFRVWILRPVLSNRRECVDNEWVTDRSAISLSTFIVIVSGSRCRTNLRLSGIVSKGGKCLINVSIRRMRLNTDGYSYISKLSSISASNNAG